MGKPRAPLLFLGLYDAATDYDGSLPSNSSRSLSKDDLAFKQFGPRTSLSLWSDYEYISSVPEMRDSNGNRPTRTEDDSAFATRTMLRLNIGLGPAPLYPAAPAYNKPIK